MESSSDLNFVQSLLVNCGERFTEPEEGRVDVYLPADNIVEAVSRIVSTGEWHLSAITGLDIPQMQNEDGQIEIIYHFCRKSIVVSLRIKVPYGNPIAPSICGVIPSAVLYEREVVEMFGVILDGTPMRERLLLPDDWPDFVYPLRKSFKGLD